MGYTLCSLVDKIHTLTETSVTICQTMGRHIPVDSNLHKETQIPQKHIRLRSRTATIFFLH
jgi:hypothetical protein